MEKYPHATLTHCKGPIHQFLTQRRRNHSHLNKRLSSVKSQTRATRRQAYLFYS